jgi:TrmH family RNA methyltransferase
MRYLPAITSARNPFFRHCLTLRDNRKRRRAKQFLIDGSSEILRAVRAGFEVTHMIVSEGEHDDFCSEVIGLRSTISVQPIVEGLIERLRYGQTVGQPLALAIEPTLALEQLRIDSSTLILALDRTEKPGNLGACLRTAEACGADVVLTDPICDPFNANVIRSSRGAVFGVPLAVTTRQEFLQVVESLSLRVYAARVNSEDLLWHLPLASGAVLLFGNETQGLSDLWNAAGIRDFTIPMTGGVDSLNLSISAAVTLFECVRQRRLAAE